MKPPQHFARAQFLDYRGKKYGEHPNKTELGLVFFPAETSLDQAESAIRREFPAANWAQIYDETARLWAAVSL